MITKNKLETQLCVRCIIWIKTMRRSCPSYSLSLSWVSWCQNVSILYFIGDDGCGGNNWSYKTYKAPVKPSPPINQHPAFYRVPAPEDTKKSRLFKGFYSIIQVLLPVDHSIAYNPTGTWEKNTQIWSIRAWRLLVISGLSSSSTRLIATVAGSSHSHQVLLKVSHRQIPPNFSRPSTRFPKQYKDIFSFMKFKDFSRRALNSMPA